MRLRVPPATVPGRHAAAARARSAPRAKSAHEKNNQADKQDEAQGPAADSRATQIKTATAQHEEKDHHQ